MNNNQQNDSISEGDLRNLNFKKEKKNLNFKYYKKKLANNDDNNNNDDTSNQLNNNEISYTLEDYLSPPLTKSIEYELREANIINDSSYDNNISDILIDNNKLNNSNYSNLTECTIKSIETDDIKMEGGAINTTIYSIIDSDGFLQSVYEISTSLMKAPEESEEETDEETDNLYNQIYNNNQISFQQAKETDKEGLQKNNISFGIDFIFTNSSNNY